LFFADQAATDWHHDRLPVLKIGAWGPRSLLLLNVWDATGYLCSRSAPIGVAVVFFVSDAPVVFARAVTVARRSPMARMKTLASLLVL